VQLIFDNSFNMFSLAVEESEESKIKAVKMINVQDDPYDVEKCAQWIQTNTLKQV